MSLQMSQRRHEGQGQGVKPGRPARPELTSEAVFGHAVGRPKKL
ncbi:hypothetical protein HMPREF1557_00069 [Streptococcus sobrinus W1703]|uniref:Uncharacterized protein n=1 Tax=Streptococcus sobrinus W1703 TaxID=1227275 RepID=U2KPF5_9STRE|nr:hypothetical protein HMPREF1557_00069 [Streptococcus sobrinus W1703]